MNAYLIIPAAGLGRRLGTNGPKALVDLVGRPMIIRTIERFVPLDLADGAFIVVPQAEMDAFARVLRAHLPDLKFHLVAGGPERQDSVANALDALPQDAELVLVHDAARPFVSPDAIAASCSAAKDYGAATVALPAADTILVADEEECLDSTPPRAQIWQCQTPQTFRVELLREAHRRAKEDGHLGTDDASLVRRIGGRVKLVRGTPLNFKVTTQADLALAALVLREGLA